MLVRADLRDFGGDVARFFLRVGDANRGRFDGEERDAGDLRLRDDFLRAARPRAMACRRTSEPREPSQFLGRKWPRIVVPETVFPSEVFVQAFLAVRPLAIFRQCDGRYLQGEGMRVVL